MSYQYKHPTADAGPLAAEILAAGLPVDVPAVRGPDAQGLVTVFTTRPLDAGEQAALAALVAAHDPGEARLKAIRAAAVAMLDATGDWRSTVIRAIILETLDYANAQRQQFNALIAWLRTQITLTQRQQLAGFALSVTTPSQARGAIQTRIATAGADA